MTHAGRLAAILILAAASLASATDWPQFRADAARSGYTPEALPQQLTLRWVYHASHKPAPAWPTRNRLAFDRAYQPIVVRGTLCFGSSADDRVYALDAASGHVRWTFCTNGPVRFAPAAYRDRLFVASDDGHLYCLALDSGRLLWKHRGGPKDDILLGNDRMISRWPARGGPVVADDVVYYGAGIWPSEGIFLYALDPETGKVLWTNDSSGTLEMDQPHASARARSGLSAQGYLAVSGDDLLVATGRAVPAVLDRADGTLRLFPLQAHQYSGGADVMACDRYFANGGHVYVTTDGKHLGKVGLQTAVHPKYFIHASENKVRGLSRRQLTVQRDFVDRRGKTRQTTTLTSPAWEIDTDYDAEPARELPPGFQPLASRVNSTAWTTPTWTGEAAALIVAAEQVVVGGRARVCVVDIANRSCRWSADVEGMAHGLAVADGRLYVSTDRGLIYCFDATKVTVPTHIQIAPVPLTGSGQSPHAEAAREILRRTKVTAGYCVDVGCGDGSLTLELAQRTNLRIYAVDPDPQNVYRLRQRLTDAGLYGVRVTVHSYDLARVPYADYCADLVVSGRSVAEVPDATLTTTARRLQSPCGGVLCLGPADKLRVAVRGSLQGAGDWTHQNTNPANTLCSSDERLHGPLEMLWFRDTDFLMANRHGRAPSALIQNSRMFAEGLDGLRAQSIYNGRVLWEFSCPGILAAYHREHSIGAAWTGGNMCLGAERVFLHDGRGCFVLDAATGKQLARYQPPQHPDGKAGTWGYLAYLDGILFGSLANEDYLVKCWSDRWDTGDQFTESRLFFALDADTGRLLWKFSPKHSLRHNAIALGGGRVYLIDRPVAIEDDRNYVAASRKQRRGTHAKKGANQEQRDRPEHPPGRLVALSLQTGKPIWAADTDIFGTLLVYAANDDLLWMGYQAAHQASRSSERAHRMAVFRAGSGERLWAVEAQYADRPVLNGRTIYAPPGAWDLLTGQKLPFALERSYGCGIVVGSPQMLIFRSATLGYIDLAVSPAVQNYGGIRPGCWIAGIPAGGVLVMPDTASWCTCSYLNQGTLVLRPSATPDD